MRRTILVAVIFAAGFMARGIWNGFTVQAESDGHGAGTPSGNGDVNGDGTINLSDGVYILNWLFVGGPAPVPIECPPPQDGTLPATGQTKCHGAAGNEIACDNADYPGQDAFYQAGCPMVGRFIDNLDGTVTDTCTGLMWQKDTADVSGNGSIGAEDLLHWKGALKYCESLSFAGHDDWRLPNVRELQSILNYGRRDPSIDPVFGAVSFYYWSSSDYLNFPGYEWYVNFVYGGSGVGQGAEGYYVRAVRGGL